MKSVLLDLLFALYTHCVYGVYTQMRYNSDNLSICVEHFLSFLLWVFLRTSLKIVLSGKYKWKYIWSQNEETFSKHMTKSKKIGDLNRNWYVWKTQNEK